MYDRVWRGGACGRGSGLLGWACGGSGMSIREGIDVGSVLARRARYGEDGAVLRGDWVAGDWPMGGLARAPLNVTSPSS